MGVPSNILYHAVVGFIKTYKLTEKQVLKLFPGPIERKAIEIAESVGVVYDFVDDEGKPEKIVPSEEEDKRILAKYGNKFDRVIHFRVKKKKEFFNRICNEGSMGCGETWMDGLWDADPNGDDLMEYAVRFMENNLLDLYMNKWNWFLNHMELLAFNLQTKTKAKDVVDKHYDLGNDLYELMLDPYMQYTCGYWAHADNLDQAQEDKLELIAKKLELKPGMTLLDIGCGWGMLCKYMAEKHGVHCVGVTISEEQAQYAREKCQGLSVEIRIQDYRDVTDKFDRMVVVGMLEHVGYHNYKEFFDVAHRNLKDDGMFLVHMIGLNHRTMPRAEPWILQYIFPNSNLPYPASLAKKMDKLFVIEDWHNFGPDYAKTLSCWRKNFIQSWPNIQHRYGERFYRMWIYYLALCEGIFRARKAQLWQVVLSKDGLKREVSYRAPR